jgi:hypothetical protein
MVKIAWWPTSKCTVGQGKLDFTMVLGTLRYFMRLHTSSCTVNGYKYVKLCFGSTYVKLYCGVTSKFAVAHCGLDDQVN